MNKNKKIIQIVKFDQVKGVNGKQGPPGIQGLPGPTNISSNVYSRSETVNLTQFSEAFVPCDEGDNILTGGYSFNLTSDDIVVV